MVPCRHSVSCACLRALNTDTLSFSWHSYQLSRAEETGSLEVVIKQWSLRLVLFSCTIIYFIMKYSDPSSSMGSVIITTHIKVRSGLELLLN